MCNVGFDLPNQLVALFGPVTEMLWLGRHIASNYNVYTNYVLSAPPVSCLAGQQMPEHNKNKKFCLNLGKVYF